MQDWQDTKQKADAIQELQSKYWQWERMQYEIIFIWCKSERKSESIPLLCRLSRQHEGADLRRIWGKVVLCRWKETNCLIYARLVCVVRQDIRKTGCAQYLGICQKYCWLLSEQPGFRTISCTNIVGLNRRNYDGLNPPRWLARRTIQ